ncbi:lysophospholipase [Gordonia sp. HY285]|nr:lysophospholipase [Gordonia liuliyuniae]
MSSVNVRVETWGPSNLAVRIWSVENPRGVVILQHGYHEHSGRFEYEHGGVVERLVGSGLMVVAPDMWGHGSSPGRRGAVHVGRAVHDHRAIRLRVAAFGLPTVLVGYSLGGLVTCASAARDQSALAGVVLVGPLLPGPIPGPVRCAIEPLARVTKKAWAPVAKPPWTKLSHDSEVLARVLGDPLMHNKRFTVLSGVTAFDATRDIHRHAASWRVPVLLLHGTEDVFTRPQWSRRLYRTLATSEKTFTEYAGAYHEVLSDPVAVDAVDDVVDWVCERIERAVAVPGVEGVVPSLDRK